MAINKQNCAINFNPYLHGVFLNLIHTGGGQICPPSGKIIYRTPIFDFSSVLESLFEINMSLCFDFSQIFYWNRRQKVKCLWNTLFFFQNDIFGKLALLSPILALEFFPLAEFLQIWPWMKYISFFAKYRFLWIFFDKSDFWTFDFSLLSFDKSSVGTPPHFFFSFFLQNYE